MTKKKMLYQLRCADKVGPVTSYKRGEITPVSRGAKPELLIYRLFIGVITPVVTRGNLLLNFRGPCICWREVMMRLEILDQLSIFVSCFKHPSLGKAH